MKNPLGTNQYGTPRPAKERFLDLMIPEPNTGCWLWIGFITHRGYGAFNYSEMKGQAAHRASYLLFKGPIPDGYHVHHRCETPSCVNPDHLEAVSPYQHTYVTPKGPGFTNRSKTHCKRGHPFEGRNLILIHHRTGAIGRTCRICSYARSRKWEDENKERELEKAREYMRKKRAAKKLAQASS